MYQLIAYIYNNQQYSHFLDGLTHPLTEAPITNLESGKGGGMQRMMSMNFARERDEATKANKLINRLNHLDKSDKIEEIID